MEYSKKILEHFKNPHNMGKLKDADAMGRAGNPVCGDVMEIYIKVKDGKIIDVSFQTLGCAVAIAMSSILTDLVKGKTLEEAEKITEEEILKELGNIPKPKIHCSLLAKQALKKAIENYKNKVKK